VEDDQDEAVGPDRPDRADVSDGDRQFRPRAVAVEPDSDAPDSDAPDSDAPDSDALESEEPSQMTDPSGEPGAAVVSNHPSAQPRRHAPGSGTTSEAGTGTSSSAKRWSSAPRRRGLGRGLGALLALPPDASSSAAEDDAARVDPLTNLPNRTLLDERLEEALANCRADAASLAVLVISLDGFSRVNELFGHRVGDALLHDVAERMSATRRKTDTVARFAGDEFVVVCPYVGSTQVACRMAARILEDVSRPVSVEGSEHQLSASIGVVVVDPDRADDHGGRGTGIGFRAGTEGPTEADSVESLLGDAALAMQRVKDEGGGAWRLFDASMREDAETRHQYRQGLRMAMEDGGLFLEYEPIVSLVTGDVVGDAALLAWRLPESIVEGPEALLELVDEAGLSVPVGRWVLDEAMADLSVRRVQRVLPTGYRVWIKLSASFVTDSAMVEAIDELTAKHRVPSSMIGIDIGEPSPAALASVEPNLQALVVRDVALALDEFGVRPSNLTLLQRLPVGSIKLAPDVVAALDEDDGQEAAALVQGLVALGRALGLSVVAEGVESENQLSVLRDLGCDLAQGPFLDETPPSEPLWATGTTGPGPKVMGTPDNGSGSPPTFR